LEKLDKDFSLRPMRNCTGYLHGRKSTEFPLLTRELPAGKK